jgi:hypothetical protein
MGCTVHFVRMSSPAWPLSAAELDAAIDATVHRVKTRPEGADNAVNATQSSGGVYVEIGATRTEVCG